jgi:hypothetical protein
MAKWIVFQEQMLTKHAVVDERAGCFIFYGIETGTWVMKTSKYHPGSSFGYAMSISTAGPEDNMQLSSKKEIPETIHRTLRFALELKPTIASFDLMVLLAPILS